VETKPATWQEVIDVWANSRSIKQAESLIPVSLSIVVPAFNEEKRLLPPLLETLDYCDGCFSSFEIIVVDDGSVDHTTAIARHLGGIHSAVKIITLPKNSGKGAALRAGVLESSGALVLLTDADGSTAITEIARLLPYYNQGYEIIIGSRATLDASVSVQAKRGRKFLGKAFNLLVNTLLIPEVADTQCGFKLFSRDAARYLFSRQHCNGFGFDTEILYIAQRCNIKIKEVAVSWHHVEGSKVSLAWDSLKMFLDLLKHRWHHHSLTPSDFRNAKF
jgi:dolichyl-phosphate beta-glucosyltransferase